MRQRSFVLVPGAGGNAGFWQLVEPLLHKAGFHSVAVSLPNWPGATLADQADAIVATAEASAEITVVAQSMGAFSAPLAGDRLAVAELVLLNAMIPAPGETAGEWWANTGQADAMRSNDLREGRDPDAGFDAQTYFLHDLPPDVLALLMYRRARRNRWAHCLRPAFRSPAGRMSRPRYWQAVMTGFSLTTSNVG